MVSEMSELLVEDSSRNLRLRAVGSGRFGRVWGLALREVWLECCERNLGRTSPDGALALRLKLVLQIVSF